MATPEERFQQYKAMKASQGVDMARFEAYKAMKAQSTDPYGRPIARAEQVREEYPSEKFGRYTEPIAAIAGGAISRVPVVGIAGAALGAAGAEAIRQGIQHFGGEPIAPKTSEEASGRIVRAMGRGAGGELLGRGMIGAASVLTPSKPLIAQGVRAMTGVPEKATMRVLNEPAILSGPGKKEAGKAYGEAFKALNIETGEEGVRQTFGKSVLGKEKIYDIFDEMAPQLKEGNVSLQKAFSLRKAISDELGDVSMAEKETLRRLSQRKQVLDDYIEAQVPEWGNLRKGYADAMAAEEFASWLPLNKNLSPNVLRTTAGLASSIKGLSEGSPIMSLALPAVSPKLYGYGIRAGAAALPVVKGVGKTGAIVGGQAISGAVLPSSTEELMRKHYEAQK